eukprot:SAG22_NODE_3576_length_1633_cov_3.944589_1_plen_87_part_10
MHGISQGLKARPTDLVGGDGEGERVLAVVALALDRLPVNRLPCAMWCHVPATAAERGGGGGGGAAGGVRKERGGGGVGRRKAAVFVV